MLGQGDERNRKCRYCVGMPGKSESEKEPSLDWNSDCVRPPTGQRDARIKTPNAGKVFKIYHL